MKFRKSHRANNPAQWLGKDLPNHFQDIQHAGTQRSNVPGRCYHGNNSGYYNLGNPAILQISNFRVSFNYIPETAPGVGTYGFIQVDKDNNNSGYAIYVSATTLRFQIFHAGTWTILEDAAADTKLVVGENNKIVCELYNDTGYLYINGVLSGTEDFSNLIYLGTGVSNLMRYTFGVATQFPLIDGFVYDFIIDELDVSGDFLQNLANYKCEEKTGTIGFDSSGNDNHGTATNAITVPVDDNPNSIHQYQYKIPPYLNTVGFTISDGISYYLDSANTQLIPGWVLIPRLENSPLPPFKCAAYSGVGVRADLQFIGHGQNDAEYVNSAGFKGDGISLARVPIAFIASKPNIQIKGKGNGVFPGMICGRYNPANAHYFSISRVGTDFISCTVISENIDIVTLSVDIQTEPIFEYDLRIYGNNVFFTVNGVTVSDTITMTGGLRLTGSSVDFTINNTDNGTTPYEGVSYDIEVNELDISGVFVQKLSEWSLQTPILDAGNKTYLDKTQNGNAATLINGSISNQGIQSESHDLQNNGYTIGNGSNGAPVGHIIPASSVNPTLDAVGNILGVVQNGDELLKCGGTTGIEAPLSPSMVQADKSLSFWFNHVTDPPTQNVIRVADFVSGINNDKIFADVTDSERVKKIRTHKSALVRAQLDTEKRITNN